MGQRGLFAGRIVVTGARVICYVRLIGCSNRVLLKAWTFMLNKLMGVAVICILDSCLYQNGKRKMNVMTGEKCREVNTTMSTLCDVACIGLLLNQLAEGTRTVALVVKQ